MTINISMRFEFYFWAVSSETGHTVYSGIHSNERADELPAAAFAKDPSVFINRFIEARRNTREHTVFHHPHNSARCSWLSAGVGWELRSLREHPSRSHGQPRRWIFASCFMGMEDRDNGTWRNAAHPSYNQRALPVSERRNFTGGVSATIAALLHYLAQTGLQQRHVSFNPSSSIRWSFRFIFYYFNCSSNLFSVIFLFVVISFFNPACLHLFPEPSPSPEFLLSYFRFSVCILRYWAWEIVSGAALVGSIALLFFFLPSQAPAALRVNKALVARGPCCSFFDSFLLLFSRYLHLQRARGCGKGRGCLSTDRTFLKRLQTGHKEQLHPHVITLRHINFVFSEW